MAVSYGRLWKLLVDKKMSKADLCKAAGLAPDTMPKLRRRTCGNDRTGKDLCHSGYRFRGYC